MVHTKQHMNDMMMNNEHHLPSFPEKIHLKRPRLAKLLSDVSKKLQKEFIQMCFYSSKEKGRNNGRWFFFPSKQWRSDRRKSHLVKSRRCLLHSPSCHHLPEKTKQKPLFFTKKFFMHEMTSKWNLLAWILPEREKKKQNIKFNGKRQQRRCSRRGEL